MTIKTADLSDAHAGNLQVVDSGLLDYGGKRRFHGEIVTIRALDDFSRVREQVNLAGDGRVLVIDNRAVLKTAMLGDRLAAAALSNGWQGVVINGSIRDSAEIADMELGVKALGTTPLRSNKLDQGDLSVVVEFLGAEFRPGDFLYADEDGILLSSQALIEPAL